jgi:DNA-binding response OmpR family regulator
MQDTNNRRPDQSNPRPEKSKTRLLLVDDDDMLRETLCLILEHDGFEVSTASNVIDALKLITASFFDVLVSDLHMPNAGDGLTVVSAMRHANPRALTFIFSAHSEMKAAAAALLAQTDDIFVKPQAIGSLVSLIRTKIASGTTPPRVISTIATILEEETQPTIKDWLARADADRRILTIQLTDAERTAHLPQLFRDLVYRMKHPLPLGSRALVSPAAARHGVLRREQGYTAAMIVEESRMLQVSIFQTLQNNLNRVNFSLLLVAVMAIADEVDSQLAQAMTAYVADSEFDALPETA